jgi:hypothetical protein
MRKIVDEANRNVAILVAEERHDINDAEATL